MRHATSLEEFSGSEQGANQTGPTPKTLVARLLIPLLSIGVAVHIPTVMAQSAGGFTPAGNMTTTRSGHTATLLQNGKVLIAGGAGVSAEFYDPDSGAFTITGDMTRPRHGHTAVLLPSGKVLIAGGAGASAELYDPNRGTFSATGDMVQVRVAHTATLLGNGKV